MTTVVLVRHGQASFGTANYDRLSPLGERQALILGQHWRDSGFAAGRALSGSLQRQQRTAVAALGLLGSAAPALATDPAFNEFNHTQLLAAYLPRLAAEDPALKDLGSTVLKDPALFRPIFHKVVAAWTEAREPDGAIDETWADFCARCVDGVRRTARSADPVVAFTSGGVITAVLREALGLDNGSALRLNWRIWNASVHAFHLSDKGLTLTGFNDIAHLQLARDETLLTRL